jgi:hypothetical protein
VFEIHGKIGGKIYKLGFRIIINEDDDDGEDDFIISGDDAAIEKFLSESKKDHGVLGGNYVPLENYSFKDGYLKSEYSAAALADIAVFDTITKFIDDWENDLPEGAIP